MKKLFSLLLALALILSLGAPAFAGADAQASAYEPVTVLYTNDIHTHIDQELNFALTAMYRDTFDNVLLVDAGDQIQGTVFGAMDKGRTVIDLMNAVGYDLATLGNHEFDYGIGGALDAVEWADFPYVSCNFYHEKDGSREDNVLDPYKVFEVGGRKIAFIGITTPESFYKSTPAYFQDDDGNFIYGIAGDEDGAALYESVQQAINDASTEADTVIALGHLGVDPAASPWTSREVIAHTTGLDAFIDGHSHEEIPMEEVTDAGGNTVILTQAGSYFQNLGRMTIAPDGAIETTLMSMADVKAAMFDLMCAGEKLDMEEDVRALNASWIAQVEEDLGEVIGTTEDVLVNYDKQGNRLVRCQETNTGDFVADALYYLFNETNIVEGYPADVAITNGGGIRSGAVTGEISYLTCKNMLPFGNVACLVQVTGQQILDMLEHSVRLVGTDKENGGFLQVSGLKFTVDTSVDSSVETGENNEFLRVIHSRRVKDVMVLSHETGKYEPLDPEATYNVAGTNYLLRDLGEGYSMLQGAVNILDYVMEEYMVLANYINSFEDTDGDGLPNVTGYSDVNGDGRITIE